MLSFPERKEDQPHKNPQMVRSTAPYTLDSKGQLFFWLIDYGHYKAVSTFANCDDGKPFVSRPVRSLEEITSLGRLPPAPRKWKLSLGPTLLNGWPLAFTCTLLQQLSASFLLLSPSLGDGTASLTTLQSQRHCRNYTLRCFMPASCLCADFFFFYVKVRLGTKLPS